MTVSNFYYQSINNFSEKEKNDLIQAIAEKIIKIAQSNPGVLKGEIETVYRFSLTSEKRNVFQWERYGVRSWDSLGETSFEKTAGVLRCNNQTFIVAEPAGNNVEALIVGDEETRKGELPLKCLYPLLEGDCFERIRVVKMDALKSNYFDRWEVQKELYRTVIYPEVLQVMVPLLPPNGTVLELCGGDGEFAKLLFNNQETSKQIARYYLIDLNKESIDRANLALKEECLNKRAYVIEGNIETFDYTQVIESKVDFLFGIGALTEQVLPKRQIALKALKKATDCLKEGGFILLKGLTTSWVTSNDLEELGYNVLNFTSSYSFRYEKVAPEFYIAQKVSVAKKVNSIWKGLPSYPTQSLEYKFVWAGTNWTGH